MAGFREEGETDLALGWNERERAMVAKESRQEFRLDGRQYFHTCSTKESGT